MQRRENSQPTMRVVAVQHTVPNRPITRRQPAVMAQRTMPHQPVRQAHAQSPAQPRRVPRPPQHRAQPRLVPNVAPKRGGANWLLIMGAMVAGLMLCTCAALGLGVAMVYSGGVLPGVRVAGIELGGLSQSEAAARLRDKWTVVTLTDTATRREWNVNPAEIGLTFDVSATAKRAYEQGRGKGDFLSALSGVDVAPVISVDMALAQSGLEGFRSMLEKPAVNAGVRLVNGVVEPAPAENGRALDLTATLAQLNNGKTLANGKLSLVMFDTAPTVTDSSGMVAAATQLLGSPLSIRAYDPVTGDSVWWEAQPETWARWLTAVSDSTSALGMRLSLDENRLTDFLTNEAASIFDESRYLDIDKAVAAVQEAIAANRTEATVRVYHHDTQHVVQSGETIVSIAWDYGVPYPWVQKFNPGVNALSVGQTITIPSPDNFLQYEPVPGKRIVVSISQQHVWVYENDQLKWDWVASTGISSSPTWPGLYQIISHEPNAYAANWDLWMPNFMGVYQPIPGSGFTNGFHGFPTRGGGQLLWENSLGTKVTYGCILLSNTNVKLLYDWAPEGVVVEIQP